MADSVSHEQSAGQGTGGVRWEIGFYEDILGRNPNYVEVLMLLGGLYTSSRMYAEGLRVDRRLAALQQDDPIVHYNLACSYALLNQAHKAFEALDKAIQLGYRDVAHLSEDEDLNNIRRDSRYAEIVARLQPQPRP